MDSNNSHPTSLPVQKPAVRQAKPPYLLVFIALAILTGMEVAASYLPAGTRVPILAILAATKVLLVLLFFMHLKFDHRIFTFPFVIGLVIALPIILAVTLAMPVLAPLFK